LTGTVDTPLEKAEAGELASLARGVTRVENLLEVEDPRFGFYYDPYAYDLDINDRSWRIYTPGQVALDDDAIREGIEAELVWNPFVAEQQIEVSVRDGVATLSGAVGSWRQRDAASKSAHDGGAIDVVNLLRVEPALDFTQPYPKGPIQ
jgi:osmotically-inducible protein OsmY